MAKDELLQYLNGDRILDSIKENREELISSKILNKFLLNNKIEDLYEFADEFWKNPMQSVKDLKDKYGITTNIGYSDIIKAFDVPIYINFLLDLYKGEYSKEELYELYNIPINRIEEVKIDIKYEDNKYCPSCLDNTHILRNRNNKLTTQCNNCGVYSEYDELLSIEEAAQRFEKRTMKIIEFNKEIEKINEQLEEIKCPRCQSKLILYKDETNYTYTINCEKCRFISNDINNTIELYHQWRKRAAMMIRIKEKEDEIIENVLNSKDESDIIIKNEEIISQSFCKKSIEYIFNNSLKDDELVWREYFKIIRKCKRIEKIVLVTLLEECKRKNQLISLTYKGQEVSTYEYSTDEPIVVKLMELTNIIVIRQVLKMIIERNLIIVDENSNNIFVPKILLDNIELIKGLLVQQNINSNIKYFIFEKQQFSCYTCGENGRPLKIAYLNSLKNTNDLSSMVGICDGCYDIVTKNEIIIDATIINEESKFNEDESLTWKFLITYLPQLEDSQVIYDKVIEWNNEYEEEDIIKALAISINKIKSGNVSGTVSWLINYTNGILRNDSITIWDNLIEKFKLSEWIDIL